MIVSEDPQRGSTISLHCSRLIDCENYPRETLRAPSFFPYSNVYAPGRLVLRLFFHRDRSLHHLLTVRFLRLGMLVTAFDIPLLRYRCAGFFPRSSVLLALLILCYFRDTYSLAGEMERGAGEESIRRRGQVP